MHFMGASLVTRVRSAHRAQAHGSSQNLLLPGRFLPRSDLSLHLCWFHKRQSKGARMRKRSALVSGLLAAGLLTVPTAASADSVRITGDDPGSVRITADKIWTYTPPYAQPIGGVLCE
jgi:hypothetical protein